MAKSVAIKNEPSRSRWAVASAPLYAADGTRKYVNAAERGRALKAIAALDPNKALFALILAWTGARVSEALALTPASFQIEGGLVAIVTLKRRRFIVREVPIPTNLMDALIARFDLRAAQLDPSRAQQRLWLWRRETGWRIIKKIMSQAGVVGRSACPRGLRHGFGVGTLQAGIPITLVQRWLGHARISTTAIYTEACGPEERAIASRFWEPA
jgi:integrase